MVAVRKRSNDAGRSGGGPQSNMPEIPADVTASREASDEEEGELGKSASEDGVRWMESVRRMAEGGVDFVVVKLGWGVG